MRDAHEVARFFIEQAALEGGTIDQLKLHKLLYYAQGVVLACLDEPAFSIGHIEAWDYGPVTVPLYYTYNRFGSDAITPEYRESGFRRELEWTLLSVWDQFGRLSSGKLVERTHRERPWKSVYVPGKNHTLISQDSIAEFFVEQKKKYAFIVPPVPPKRDLYASRQAYESNPVAWNRAAANGAVVRVMDTDQETELLRMGQHIREDFLRESDFGQEDESNSPGWLN